MIIIETERLLLRTWEERDIEPMSLIDSDPKVCEFLPTIGNRQATEESIKRIIDHYNRYHFCLYATELKTTGELIGWIGLNVPAFESHFTPCVEIGWRLGSQFWGQGLATEGAKAVLDYGFEKLALTKIFAFTVPNNIRSLKVMHKIGMQRVLDGDFHHPKLPYDHPLSLHVLYRIINEHKK